MNRKYALLFATLLAAPTVAFAQTVPVERAVDDNTRFGGTSAVFLTLPSDSRGTALGGAYSALVSDIAAVFYNPAGLALLTSNQAMFSFTPYIDNTHHLAAGVGWSLRGGEVGLGLSIINFGFNDQPEYTEEFQNGTGETYSVQNTAVGLTASMQFSDRFSAGITGRYVTEHLAEVQSAGFTVDFGTNYHGEVAGRPIRASFTILNYGPSLRPRGAVLNNDVDPIDESMNVEGQPSALRTTAFEPPIQFRVGVAYDFLSTASNRLTFLSEFNQPNDSDPGVGVGAEFSATLAEGMSAALRGSYGYQGDNRDSEISSALGFRSSVDSDQKLDGLAVGGGLNWSRDTWNVGADYAFRHMGVLGAVSQFSIKFGW
jgi:hypothetical protein